MEFENAEIVERERELYSREKIAFINQTKNKDRLLYKKIDLFFDYLYNDLSFLYLYNKKHKK